MNIIKKLSSEFIGTLFLLAIVVGSGIMGERLSQGNTAIALLANSVATGLGLSVLIIMFGSISGAHFNPLVTLTSYFEKQLSRQEVFLYLLVQLLGAAAGVMAAHLMFGELTYTFSSRERAGPSQLFSEFIATFGLILVIRIIAQKQPEKVSYAVGAYIAAAYWFTASTSFANPAVTIARSLTSTFAGIRPDDILGFVVAQTFGAVVAEAIFRLVFKEKELIK